MTAVLDASAVLTLLYREAGHDVVAELVAGAVISAVNWSEVAFGRGDAETAAELWPAGRARGLSLGDRACLAVATAVPDGYAVTADSAWADVQAGVEVRVIR